MFQDTRHCLIERTPLGTHTHTHSCTIFQAGAPDTFLLLAYRLHKALGQERSVPDTRRPNTLSHKAAAKQVKSALFGRNSSRRARAGLGISTSGLDRWGEHHASSACSPTKAVGCVCVVQVGGPLAPAAQLASI